MSLAWGSDVNVVEDAKKTMDEPLECGVQFPSDVRSPDHVVKVFMEVNDTMQLDFQLVCLQR